VRIGVGKEVFAALMPQIGGDGEAGLCAPWRKTGATQLCTGAPRPSCAAGGAGV
jgi:hypothetical protein